MAHSLETKGIVMHDPVLFALSLIIPLICIIWTIARHVQREEKDKIRMQKIVKEQKEYLEARAKEKGNKFANRP